MHVTVVYHHCPHGRSTKWWLLMRPIRLWTGSVRCTHVSQSLNNDFMSKISTKHRENQEVASIFVSWDSINTPMTLALAPLWWISNTYYHTINTLKHLLFLKQKKNSFGNSKMADKGFIGSLVCLSDANTKTSILPFTWAHCLSALMSIWVISVCGSKLYRTLGHSKELHLAYQLKRQFSSNYSI